MSVPDATGNESAVAEVEVTTSSSSSSSSSSNCSTEGSQVLLHTNEVQVQPVLMSMAEDDNHPDGMLDEVKEYFCGLGKCRPKWLQIFGNSKFFTFLMCLNATIEGALVSGFTSVVLSTIERRYGFPSVWVGIIASVFDMSVLVSVLFISYFGGRGHKPRWLGVSLIIQGIGAFVFSLPQFLFGSYEGMNINITLCDGHDLEEPDCSSVNRYPLILFFLGNILIGVGAAPLFTVGTAYLDDIVLPKYVTIHLGAFYAFAVIGPALGYGLGGIFLSIYVDPWRETDLEPSNPAWVGAWWMCFIFAGVMSWLCAIPFLLFPKYLHDSSLVKQERLKEMAQKYDGVDGAVEEVDLATKIKKFPQHLLQVVKTPSWVFITTAICFSTLIVSGVTSFGPKYLESQFRLTASRASLIAGAVAIPSGGVGVFIGGLIIYFTKSKGRNVALINWIVTLIALAPTFVFIVHCPTLELVGLTEEYPDGSMVESSIDTFNASCIDSCNCTSSRFEPVCGDDGNTYFSPCTAGCQIIVVNNNTMEMTFENCTCVAEKVRQMDNISLSGIFMGDFVNTSAVEGKCDQGCNLLGVFLGVLFFALLLLFILQVPNIIITVRCVADEQRTLALGAQSVAFRALGSIPGPILFGVIFDSACIYWQYECSQRGNCWVYNNTQLSQRAVAMAMLGIATNLVFSFLAWLFYPKKNVTQKDTTNRSDEPEKDSPTATGRNKSGEPFETEERPKERSSRRMDSHTSEDILLDDINY